MMWISCIGRKTCILAKILFYIFLFRRCDIIVRVFVDNDIFRDLLMWF
jgi:hypothetical protein